jgi:hypothetical protein
MPMSPDQRPPLAGAAAGDGPEAARDAVRSSVAALDGGRPGLVFVFPDALDPATAHAQATEAANGAPVCGMTASGALADGVALAGGGCSAIAFSSEIVAGVGVAERASADPVAAGRVAAADALRNLAPDAPHRLLVLMIDTRSGDQSNAIAGAYSAAGPGIPLIGGAAGGSAPAQLGPGGALTDSVVAVAIGSRQPIGVGIGHGCGPCAAPAVVTRSRGRVIERLDGRQADEVYLERLGLLGVELDAEEFARVATVHPLAQPELRGDARLRHVLGRAPAGGLTCATHVPENAAVEFAHQDAEGIIASTWDAVSEALLPLGGGRARAALVFDCAGRRSALGGPGPALDREADATAVSFGDGRPPLAGLYTRGEVGRVRGAKGDRNHAIVVAAFG